MEFVSKENETVDHQIIVCECHEYEIGMLVNTLKEAHEEEVIRAMENRGRVVMLGLEDKMKRILCTEDE